MLFVANKHSRPPSPPALCKTVLAYPLYHCHRVDMTRQSMHLLTMVHSFSLIVEVVSGIRVHVDVAAFAFEFGEES